MIPIAFVDSIHFFGDIVKAFAPSLFLTSSNSMSLAEFLTNSSYLVICNHYNIPFRNAWLCDFKVVIYHYNNPNSFLVHNLNNMKTTYKYLNNLYARWKKSEKAIGYRDKFLGVKQST